MDNGIAGIDHVIVAVRDLEAAYRSWARLGFTLTPRGRHIGQRSANYCIMFGRDYLELLGFVDADASANRADAGAHRLTAFVDRRVGPMSVAFAPVSSAEHTSAALAVQGLHPSAPRALGRELELPEGAVVPSFRLVNLPPEETPSLDCFICGHLTPELVRRPEWLMHANGVTGIAAVYLAVGGIAIPPLAPAYRALFGAAAVTAEPDRVAVDTGRNRIVFTTPARLRADLPGITTEADFGIVALALTVENLARIEALLRQVPVAVTPLPDGRLIVPPHAATGTALIFAEG